MKIRSGFVSNSSSASFLINKSAVDDCEFLQAVINSANDEDNCGGSENLNHAEALKKAKIFLSGYNPRLDEEYMEKLDKELEQEVVYLDIERSGVPFCVMAYYAELNKLPHLNSKDIGVYFLASL